MINYLEKPFEYLRRKDGSKFGKDIINNWYKARAYVLKKLEDVVFRPYENDYLHVIIMGDDPLMLSVVRQVALSAHYINYDEANEEESRRKSTVITIVSNNPDIVDTLKKEEYLCNLPRYCKWSQNDSIHNKDSFIDIEINIVNHSDEKHECKNVKIIKKEEIESFCNSKTEEEVFTIDTRKALYASRVYELSLIEKYPFEERYNAKRYELALDNYHYYKLQEPLSRTLIDKFRFLDSQINVKKGLSNVFCTDCFESKKNSIDLCRNDKNKNELWSLYYEALCKSEHARWIVEKLIMGFRPLSSQERIKDESFSYDSRRRKQFRNSLKNNNNDPVHVDICSNNDLRRISPNDIKYDGFFY